jgi:DNA polymerase-3 subunit alpha
MGKKKLKEMEKHKQIFLDGAKERDYDLKKAEHLYDLMAKFAEYGFNKSHAVAYSYISYQTAFLKKYYRPEFFAALLSTELSNTDKVTLYINDAKSYDIEVLPPDVNESLWRFNVVEGNIRFGMGAVKNVGEAAVEELIREREENGSFEGFIDFCTRIDLKKVNKKVIESLIRVGAFTECEKTLNRKTMLENMELVVAYASRKAAEKELGQVSLFDMAAESDEGTDTDKMLDIQHVNDYDDMENLRMEQQLIGIYVSGHPLDKYGDVMNEMASMRIADVLSAPGNGKRDMTLAGMITGRKNIMTKKGDRMCFATLEDLSGKIECIVFPKTFVEYEDLLETDEPLILTGQVNLSEEPRKFFPGKIYKLKEQADERVSHVRINVKMEKLTPQRLERCRQILLSYRGSVPTHFIFEGSEGKARMPLGDDFLVNPTPQMAAKVNEVFESNTVRFIVDGRVEEVENIR